MKIVFCINNCCTSGGRERVLLQRANYFIEKFNYEVIIVVTSAEENPYFYINPKIKLINLRINYEEIGTDNYVFYKIKELIKHKKYLKKLNQIVEDIKPDILISLGDQSRYVCGKVKFKCKKVLEHHGNKASYIGEIKGKSLITKIKVKLSNYYQKILFRKYDEILVLTEEDKKAWDIKRIKVLNNSLPFFSEKIADLEKNSVISVGRLAEEKGFDILIEVWKKVIIKYPKWILNIYGEGELRKSLENKINSSKLENTIYLHGNEKNIKEKYLENSIYVMSSKREGMPMVLLEAMNCGLPLIAFDCPTGPKTLIKDSENGYLCECFDLNKMAERIIYLIEHPEIRQKMGKKSRELSFNYSEDKIMEQWKNLLEELIKEKYNV